MSSNDFKFYNRFTDFKANDDWSVGSTQWDALLIIPKVNLTIYGVGVFQEYPKGTANFNLNYKWILSDVDGREI